MKSRGTGGASSREVRVGEGERHVSDARARERNKKGD